MSPPQLAPTPTTDIHPDSCADTHVFKDYISYRVTVSHDSLSDVERLTREYSDNYIIFRHLGDGEIPNPHFHILIPTEDLKLFDRIKVRFARYFNKKGNEFHAGKYWHNGILSGISYCKHGFVTGLLPVYTASCYEHLLESAPTFVKSIPNLTSKGQPLATKRERLGEHVLTLGNLLKQAAKYAGTDNRLDRIILNMTVNLGFVPSRDLMTNGVPEELYELWEHRYKKNPVPMFWHKPHARSEKKQEWNDKVTLSRFND